MPRPDIDQRLKVELVAPDGLVIGAGTIHSFERGLLRIQTSRLFEEDEPIKVHVGSCSVLGKVMYSVQKGESFYTAVSLLRSGKANRRADQRIPVSWPARVSVMDEDPCAFEAEVIDVSSSGFGLSSPRAVRPATRIGVETAECVGFAEVVNCQPEANGRYRVGVRLVELIGSATAESASGPLTWLRRMVER